jgi:uncharacterized protein
MQHLHLEIKEIQEDGTFQGVASVYGLEDSYGDVIEKGAFTKTIQERPDVPILWQHDQSEVIGKGRVEERGGKIVISGKLDLEDAMGQKAYRKLKNRLINGLSIGFQTVKSFYENVEERTIRHISELKLWEVSVVTFPALTAAQVTSVKESNEIAERVQALENELKALREQKTPAAANPQPEPVQDHSRALSIIDEIRRLMA